MSKLRPFTTNFTRGELSPFIYARPDLGPYYNGLEIAENIIILPEGGATRRPGLRFIQEVKYSSAQTILIPYVRSQSLSYVIEAGPGYFRFFKNGTAIRTDSGGELITNGSFNTDLSNWTAGGTGVSAWHSSGMAQLTTKYGQAQYINQAIATTAGETYAIIADVYDAAVTITVTDSLSNIIFYTFAYPGHNFCSFTATDTTHYVSFGHDYSFGPTARVDNVSVKLVTVPIEVATPYTEGMLSTLQWVQSIDVLFIDCPDCPPQKLLGASDRLWTLNALALDPPPTMETGSTATELGGGTLVAAAATGIAITFTASGAPFLDGDAGRTLTAFGGIYQATITVFNSAGSVLADITSGPWPTTPIGESNWSLGGSPMAALDPQAREPVKLATLLIADKPAFRASDNLKYIKIWGGMLKIINVNAADSVTGQILSVLTKAIDLDPASAPAGSWTLEAPAFSAANGYPATLEFHQGRLVHGATANAPTTIFGSAADNFENYATGSLAADAYQFNVRSGKANPITWLASANELLMGEGDSSAPIQPVKIGTGSRYAKGPGVDEPLGGANIPYIGASKGQIFYIHSTRSEVRQLKYDLQQDGLFSQNLTILGRHLFDPLQGGSPIRQGAIAWAEKPNSVIYIVREDGQLVAFTHYEQEQVQAFTRFVTDGAFESVSTIPHPAQDRHQVWVIVRREIGGVTKRFVEYFEDQHELLALRKYPELVTDSATVIPHTSGTTQFISGGIGQLTYLRGETVDVIWHQTATTSKVSGRYLGQYVVSNSDAITLTEEFTAPGYFEVGLRFTPQMKLVRPANPQQNMEGRPRKWSKVFGRFKDTIGCTVNGQEFEFNMIGQPMDEGPQPLSADLQVIGQGWSTDNELTFSQSFPGPFTLLGCFGDLEVGES